MTNTYCRGEDIKITLWEDKARTFMEDYSNYKASAHVIVCGTLAKNIGGKKLKCKLLVCQILAMLTHYDVNR